MADIYSIIPYLLAYKVLESSNSVTIRFNQAEEFKYKIVTLFERKNINTAAIRLKNRTQFDVYDRHKRERYLTLLQGK